VGSVHCRTPSWQSTALPHKTGGGVGSWEEHSHIVGGGQECYPHYVEADSSLESRSTQPSEQVIVLRLIVGGRFVCVAHGRAPDHRCRTERDVDTINTRRGRRVLDSTAASIEKEEMDRVEEDETEGRISWGLWSPKVGPGDTDAIRRRAT
jgi:hypothetical protein